MTRLEYGKIARREFDGAFNFYESAQPGVGVRFEAAVKSYIREMMQNPKRFPQATRSTRVASMIDFPFHIYYRVRSDFIYIVAVYHFKREPDGWKGRK